jgi:hypothetical protein
MSKKPADLSAGLVAVKGSAVPPSDMPTRAAPVLATVPRPVAVVDDVAPAAMPANTPPAAKAGKAESLAPLNFRVSAAFRRDFKTYAATHDLKLNELLRRSFEAYRRQNGD